MGYMVSKVLKYLRSSSPVKTLTLKTLTLKLVMLIALVTASRGQSLHLLNIENLTRGKSSYTFVIDRLIKQSRPGYSNPVVKLKPYPPDRRLCVCTTLQEYLSRSENIRGTETQLYISYVKPHKAVATSTISRWIRDVMTRSGIDTSIFKAHSVRTAASSKAKMNYVPTQHILTTAGWSSTCTFAKYYDKPIVKENAFAMGVLT